MLWIVYKWQSVLSYVAECNVTGPISVSYVAVSSDTGEGVENVQGIDITLVRSGKICSGF